MKGILWDLVTDHVIIGIEHPIPPNVTDIRVIPGTIQSIPESIPEVDDRVRVPHVTEFGEFGDVEIDARCRSRVIQLDATLDAKIYLLSVCHREADETTLNTLQKLSD